MFIFGGSLSADHQPVRDLHSYDFIRKVWTKIEVQEKLLPSPTLSMAKVTRSHCMPGQKYVVHASFHEDEDETKHDDIDFLR